MIERPELRAHTGAELDLLLARGRHRIGVEVKRTTAPTVTPSMRSALTDLKLTRLYVVQAAALASGGRRAGQGVQ